MRSVPSRALAATVLTALLGLAGCVTTSTGGFQEAPKEVRLQAHLDLARGYLEHRNWSRAKVPIEQALAIEPHSAEAYTLMGVMYQGQKEPALAEKAYRRALRYDPDYAMALNNYGSFLYGQGRYQDALGPLRKLVRDPDYRERAHAYEVLGLTELRTGDREEARQAFEQALSFNTVLPRSCLELAQMAYDRNDYKTASQYYDMFRSRARQTPGSLCLGIRLARRSGDQDQLASYSLALKNLYPDSAEASRCLDGN